MYALNEIIERKKEKMQVYDKFLLDVVTEYSDDYSEPDSVVKRYQTLNREQEKLKRSN